MLLYAGKNLIGLQACCIVNEGTEHLSGVQGVLHSVLKAGVSNEN